MKYNYHDFNCCFNLVDLTKIVIPKVLQVELNVQLPWWLENKAYGLEPDQRPSFYFLNSNYTTQYADPCIF